MRGPGRIGRAAVGDLSGDRIERGASAPRTTWDTILIWFMRITALLWLAKGVHAWATILDVVPGARAFETEPVGRQAVIVYLAVIDLTAAVGLWLTSAWGGVIWLLAATSALTLAVLTPQLLPAPLPLLIAQASIVAVYFALSWFAAREGR
ncbi:DUF6163 family protein [Methylobacterium segetis]|uniref:DUF6163 family protein n=1 Tax=Methylobacterium segetis TaxID=2488750 RepID=UPI0010512741|nr:DUF6163 family protein [Methylobacterium segetis]